MRGCRWLQEQRAKYAEWDAVVEKEILCIDDEELANSTFSEDAQRLLQRQWAFCDVDEPWRDKLSDHLEQLPSLWPPEKKLHIGWMYTIDLDNEVFSVDNGAHFLMSKFPREKWIESLGYDCHGNRSVIPNIVPGSSLASLDHHGVVEELQDSLKVDLVPVKTLSELDESHAGTAFLSRLWDGLKSKLERRMQFVLPGLSSDNHLFRETAYAIISLAAGLSGIMVEDIRRLKYSAPPGDWAALVCGDDPQDPAVVVSELGQGYHRKGGQPGSAPLASCYWFQGILIQLVQNMREPALVRNAIHNVHEFGTSTNSFKPFNALLMSIEHCILIHVAEGIIQRSDCMTLLDITVHLTSNQLKRPGKAEPQEDEDDEMLGKAGTDELDAIEVEAEATELVDDESDDESRANSIGHDEVEPFLRLVNLFELGANQGLKPEQPKEGRFPTEIYEMILQQVDANTYRACCQASRKFRRICQRKPRFSDCVVLGPLDSSSQGTFRVHNTSNGVKSAHPLSLGGHGTAWSVICGDQCLTTLLAFRFVGFEARDPWEGKRRESVTPKPVAKDVYADPEGVSSFPDEPDFEHLWSMKGRVVSSAMQHASFKNPFPVEAVWQMGSEQLYRSWIWRNEKFGVVKIPPHTRKMIYPTIKGFVRSEHGKKWIAFPKEVIGIRWIKRVYSHPLDDEIWANARAEVQKEVLATVSQRLPHPVLVIICMGFHVQLFRFDPHSLSLEPAFKPNKPLYIFNEKEGRMLEGFEDELQTLRKDLEESMTAPPNDSPEWELQAY